MSRPNSDGIREDSEDEASRAAAAAAADNDDTSNEMGSLLAAQETVFLGVPTSNLAMAAFFTSSINHPFFGEYCSRVNALLQQGIELPGAHRIVMMREAQEEDEFDDGNNEAVAYAEETTVDAAAAAAASNTDVEGQASETQIDTCQDASQSLKNQKNEDNKEDHAANQNNTSSSRSQKKCQQASSNKSEKYTENKEDHGDLKDDLSSPTGDCEKKFVSSNPEAHIITCIQAQELAELKLQDENEKEGEVQGEEAPAAPAAPAPVKIMAVTTHETFYHFNAALQEDLNVQHFRPSRTT
jgi:hypothetical protein